MNWKALVVTVALISVCSLIVSPIISCKSSGGDTGAVSTLLSNVTTVKTSAQREEAVQAVINECRALGLLDKNGKQLNPNVSAEAISLTPEDVASLSGFIEIGHYRTLSSVVDFLAEAGVVLSATGEVITWDDFLPDLQKYVQWSYNNRKDAGSTLGLLIASGPLLETPAAPPTLEPSTQISPMAALLMLGDILIGTENSGPEPASSQFFQAAYAADDVTETAKRIQGMITQIENFMKPAEATLDFFKKAAAVTGLLDSSEASAPPVQLKVPDLAKKLIGAFAVGSHFGVRILKPDLRSVSEWPTVSSLEFNKEGQYEHLVLVVCLVPPPGGSTAPVEILNQIPVMYKATLVAPGLVVGDLYPDADAVLSSSTPLAETTAGGHALTVAGKGLSGEQSIPAAIVLTAKKLDNKDDRTAILHVSASILAGDLAAEYEKYSKEYASYISALQLTPEDLRDLFQVMKSAINVAPTIATVRLVGGLKMSIDPDKVTGEINKIYTFTARVDKVPAGSRWEWNASSETHNQTINQEIKIKQGPDNVAEVSFPLGGNYTVEAVLWDSDGSSATVLSSAIAEVTIKGITPDIQLGLESPAETAEVGCGVNLSVTVNDVGLVPAKSVWRWDFGDESVPVEKLPTYRSVSHTYELPGTYTVTVRLLAEDGSEIAEATGKVEVGDLFVDIYRTKAVRGIFWAYYTRATYADLNGQLTKKNESTGYTIHGLNTTEDELKWNGNQFSYTNGPTTVNTQTVTYTISGTVSEKNGVLWVDEWKFTKEFVDTNQGGHLWEYRESLALKNIPLKKVDCGQYVRFTASFTGTEAQQYFSSYEYESRLVGEYGAQGDMLDRHESIDWNRTDQLPKMEITFKVSGAQGW